MLYQAVAEVASRRPENVAVRTPFGGAETYREFLARIDRLAAGLARHGIAPGSVVACRGLPNSPDYPAFILAVAKIGACYVPLIREFDEEDVRTALRLARPELAVVSEANSTLEGVREATLEELHDAGAAGEPEGAGHGEELSAGRFRLLWSSGSTGFPKMIACRQDRLLPERQRWVRHIAVTETDVLFCRHTLDVAHATDLHLLTALLAGAQVVLADPDDSPEQLLAQLAACGATVMSALPRHYDQLAAAAEKHEQGPLPALRLALCGGTYVGPEVARRCARSLGIRLRELYGSTEYGLAAVDLKPSADADPYLPLVPGVSARLNPLTADEPDVGELVLSSPWTSEGYLNNDTAHARTFREGEYWTGDVARRNASGEYRVLGRVSEALTSSQGLLLTPGLDEDLVAHCPVGESVSLAVDPEGRGDRVRVTVRPAPGHAEADVLAAVQRRLRDTHGLKGTVRVTRRIPYTAVGKPNKAVIRRMWDAPGKPPLVMIPGLATTGRYLDGLVAEFADEHDVIVWDLPGHGTHFDPDDTVTSAPTLDSAARALRDHLDDLNLCGATLLGWSLGAAVAYTYLNRYGPHRVARLVSVEMTPRLLVGEDWTHAAFGRLDAEGALALLKQIWTDYDGFVTDLVRSSFADGSTPDPSLQHALTTASKNCRPADVVALWTDALCLDWREQLAALPLPTLLVHGARSQVFPSGVGDWLADTIPHARLVRLERSGHMPFLEQRKEFVAELRAFHAVTAASTQKNQKGSTEDDG
ncbi:hypothetical protein GCM10009716_36940 [Streptomyces sodiiphilus]|uniref:Alpha/beta fold hydrolase n=1 Tax=Streptomyces sodiiphilus TaxID=226217 RepID=A0ABN2PLU9_9ACTN